MTTLKPIGMPGKRWGEQEKALWRQRLSRKRSYTDDVATVIQRLGDRFAVEQYGQLEYPPEQYPLYAVRSIGWRADLPTMLVTGGVHGYETSGVHGALLFLDQYASAYVGKANLLVVPCVSPWGYERIQRWNPDAVDPNRSFVPDSHAQESAALMRLLQPLRTSIGMHIDLHETTDSDEAEFRPMLAARDGDTFVPGTIPDGFYLVADSENPQPGFQNAVIEAVASVTHIAPADADGTIIGSPVVAEGVIRYPLKTLGLCAGVTDAVYTTTTEVYPDSPRATAALCNKAQAVAVCAAVEYALQHPRAAAS